MPIRDQAYGEPSPPQGQVSLWAQAILDAYEAGDPNVTALVDLVAAVSRELEFEEPEP